MIRLIIGGHDIELASDATLSYTWENAFFEHGDTLCTPYTLPLEIPLTDRNRHSLGYPDRVAASGRPRQYSDCVLLCDGIQLPLSVFKVEAVETDRITGNLQGVDTDWLRRSMRSLPLNSYRIGTSVRGRYLYDEDGVIVGVNDIALQSCYTGLIKLFESLRTEDGPFVLSPIRITDNGYREDGNDERYPLTNIRSMWLNPLWRLSGSEMDWYYGTSARTTYMGAIVPAIRLPYLLQTVFGDTLVENPFTAGELARLVVQTIYHEQLGKADIFAPCLERQVPASYPDNPTTDNTAFATYFDLSCFLPAISVSDFLKELLKVFALTIYNHKGQYYLKSAQNIVNGQECIDISDRVISSSSLSIEPGMLYKYGYDIDIPEVPDEPYGRDASVSAVYAATPGDLGMLSRITSTGQLIRRTPVDTLTAGYTYVVEEPGYGGTPESDEDDAVFTDENEPDAVDVTSKLAPLTCSVHNLWGGLYRPAKWPTEVNKGGITYYWESIYCPELPAPGKRKDYPRLMIDRGRTTGLAKKYSYPLLTSKNYDAYGKRLGSLSLDWDGEDGLLERYHKPSVQFWSNPRTTLTVEAVMDIVMLANLKPWSKVYYAGRRWLIKSLSVDLTAEGMEPATMELVSSDVLF